MLELAFAPHSNNKKQSSLRSTLTCYGKLGFKYHLVLGLFFGPQTNYSMFR